MVNKKYVSADSLYEDSFRLAKKIYDSGFRPGVVLEMREIRFGEGRAAINAKRDQV